MNKILGLRNSLKEISMMDDFAKYARIERQILKLDTERQKFRKFFSINLSKTFLKFPSVFVIFR